MSALCRNLPEQIFGHGSPSTNTAQSSATNHASLKKAPNLSPTPSTPDNLSNPALPNTAPPFLTSKRYFLGNHIPSFSPPKLLADPFLPLEYDPRTHPRTPTPLQQCINPEKTFQLHVNSLFNRQWIYIEHQQLFSITNIQTCVNLVSSNFATYCNAFPTGFHEHQAQVRFSRAIKDHITLIIRLGEI
ncbi:hypothetical protein VP01_1022g5 [Puccinia sorghi]|uniref:Uncharacterized protein n=1 Tax=Puccinia sorghi TaxID=27349 RepID=A0A0L6VV12_9BASI|nr:hypothetical protein VP01_1022g5 [Puccinia sorghi]